MRTIARLAERIAARVAYSRCHESVNPHLLFRTEANYATPVFTIDNDDTYAVPVSVPAPLANAAASHGWLTVRSTDGKISRAMVDSVTNDPAGAARKIIKLLIHAADLPAPARENLIGMKFDVLLPQVAQEAPRESAVQGPGMKK